MKNNIRGSVSIEATIALTAFIFTFYYLISFASLASVEALTKNALDQTAKDLAKYSYAVETLATTETNQSDLAYKILNYASFENSINGYQSADDSGPAVDIPESIGEFSGSFAMSVFEKYIMLETNTQTYNEALDELNIEGSIDFSESSILEDGETINLVATYSVESPMSYIFEQEIIVKQSASTQAWVGDNGKLSSIGGGAESIWDLPSIERGQIWLAEYRAMRPDEAVEPGSGIDFYDGETMTSMYSMNIFSSSYGEGDYESGTYSIDEDAISRQLESYIKETIENVENIGQEITMIDGSVEDVKHPVNIEIQIIVPEEATDFADELTAIADPLEEEYGVTVTWIYQEKAFE